MLRKLLRLVIIAGSIDESVDFNNINEEMVNFDNGK